MDDMRRAKRQYKALNSRMSRGLAACAECKRMKLKCDKKVPCSTCVRRECSSICPTGVLASRHESRSILTQGSSRPESQDEMAHLRERSLKLENALAFAHSFMSKDIHPLLADAPPKERPQVDPETDHVTERLGTLAVGETGEVKYFGPSAAPETLYQTASTMEKSLQSQSLSSHQANLSSKLEGLTARFPLGYHLSIKSFVPFILSNLPQKQRAWSLCGNFYEHYPFFSMPIQREELIQAYICPLYKYLEDSPSDPKLKLLPTTFSPHFCAVTFFAFALGAWLDLNQSQYWVEANRYFQVGLSCLSMQSIFYSAEVASVHALFLLAYNNELRGAPYTTTLSPSWTILSLASKIGQGLGLHRDLAQWNLDPTTVHRRRWLYWELISMEVFHCMGTGRPLSSRPSYVDTDLPSDVGRTDAHGQPLQGFFRCKHEFVRDCYLGVVETLLDATPAKYETIIELDRKVRAKEIPAHLNKILTNPEDGPNLTAPEFMQMCVLGVCRSLVLLSVHRSYLTRALEDPSGNPLKSRYAPSFLASYRAASWIVKSFRAGQTRYPNLFPRLWHPWTNVLTAAMVLGSIATRTPSSLVGNGPLEELRVASSMFEEAAGRTVSHRTKNGAKIVQNILNQAEEAHARRSMGHSGTVLSGISIPPTNYGDDELAIFGGQARLSPVQPYLTTPQSLQRSSSNNSSSSGSSPGSLEDFHPSLIDFLTTAPINHVASPTTFQEMERITFAPPLPTPFYDPSFMPPQPDTWAKNPISMSQHQFNSGNTEHSLTSGQQVSDVFEDYLDPSAIVDFRREQTTVTPWEDFMGQSSLFD